MSMFMDYTREAIFLVFGLCAGIPALAWALLHVRGGGRVSIFIIFLLLSGAVEFFLIPFILALERENHYGYYGDLNLVRFMFKNVFAFAALTGTRVCGLIFHQLVALENILYLRHPHCFTCLSSPFCSITICLAIWICTVFFSIDTLTAVVIAGILGVMAVVASVLTCVLTARASCSCGTGVPVLAVAMGTLWFLYAPVIAVFGIVPDYDEIVSLCFCLMTFRVVADSLLCVLVCRGVPRTEAPTGIELNTVQTSD